jgi:hypothetical protein
VEFNFYGEFNLSGGGIYPHKFEKCPICYTYPFRRIPDYETPAQYEKRTGKKWERSWLVWVNDLPNDPQGWRVDCYANALDDERHNIICAQLPKSPPDNWSPEEEAKEKLTDAYGNLRCDPVGKKVRCNLAEFYVKEVLCNFRGIGIVMDSSKPYTILNKSDPMAKCMKSGPYVVAAYLCELIPEQTCVERDGGESE